MNCPACGKAKLKPVMTKQKVWVDLCGWCGGLWLDKGELYCFSGDPQALYKELKAALRGSRRSERNSPRTGAPMHEVSLRGGRLRVDYDGDTQGFWLDKTELERLTDAIETDLNIQIDPASTAAVPEGAQVSNVERLPPQEDWSLWSVGSVFAEMKKKISGSSELLEPPSRFVSVKSFLGRTTYCLKLMAREPELIVFSLLQLSAIAAGYYVWVQMLSWIPDEVWRSAESSDEGSIADIVLVLWSFVCVGITALPLGLFSACMGAVHFLHRQRQSSSIAACLKLVLHKVWPLWIFHWADGWYTVMRILDRLPKKNDRRTAAQKALSEAVYYAWKIGTIGVLPALITGRGLVEACKDSVYVVRKRAKDVLLLRGAYSALCWVVGIGAYAGMILMIMYFPELFPTREAAGERAWIYSAYLWAGVPILGASAVILIFLRPVYVISACDIYTDYLNSRKEKVLLPAPPSAGVSAFVFCAVLCVFVGLVFLYRQEWGLMDMLATPYGQEYAGGH